MNARAADSAEIKKLTKRKKETGDLYARRPEAELQILKTLSLEAAQILELLKEQQRDHENYLLDETIVYLLRSWETTGIFQEILYLELNRRIWKLLKKFSRYFNNPEDFEDFRQKVEIALIRKIFDYNSDSADYAEINFGDYVVKTAKVAWRGELVKIVKEKELFYQERETGNESGDFGIIENKLASNDSLADYTLMLREGLKKLPSHIMLAAELILDGWPIESNNADELTISKKLGVSSRTIRNWLKQARAILADYNAEVKK